MKKLTNTQKVLDTISSYKYNLSLATIATLTNMTQAQVFRAIRTLERRGDITRHVTWRKK